MLFGSVCSGIEAASAAWEPLGFRAAFVSEIEPFPCAVLAHHYPDVPNHGDLNQYRNWPRHELDILVGGTPCQSFSVAGLRKGLDDPRGNLTLTFLGCVDAYRPRWVVWENVPGVLSIDRGRTFGAFLAALGQLGYGFAYRVLDAKHFGVPQRRRRVFVVGHTGNWRRAAAVLFERESLRGDLAPRRQPGQDVTGSLAARTRGGGGLGTDFDCDGGLIPSVANPLTARMHKGVNTTMDEGQTMIAHSLRADGFDAREDGTGRGTPLVPIAFAQNQRQEVRTLDIAGALSSIRRGDAKNETLLKTHMRVRRLTVTECERLMGFQDGYTLIPYRNKPAADGPRYKALGNSMAVPVMRWLGERIAMVDRMEDT